MPIRSFPYLSIIQNEYDSENKYSGSKILDASATREAVLKNKWDISLYQPTKEEKEARALILRDFTLGTMNMWTPRVEFDDLCVIDRKNTDEAGWNTYQANDGQPSAFDDIQGWRSKAMRPIIRNKAVSIAAHATARLIFPRVFAYDDSDNEDRSAAQVMEDLMEWAADRSNYAYTALKRVISALYEPASIGYTEYTEVYRQVKRPKADGKGWEWKTECDEHLSGFQDIPVGVDELYIENFYEPDIQKQGFLILRRVISYSLAQAKYSHYKNFKDHVKPGVQTIYSDANASFYYVYDPNMREYDVEEIIYWNKTLDVKLIMVNGVLLCDPENPNPRNDKQYPFDKFGYEMINNRCFYYKSLAFKLKHDANIINTIYPMIIDGSYLNMMPPMINRGSEIITSDVIVPGAVTNLSDPNASLDAVKMQVDMKSGMEAMFKVEESINESSQDPLQQGQAQKGSQTAYEISRIEQNAATVLGLFIQMIAQHVRDFGRLRLGDILQYLTLAEADKISTEALVYKTFVLHDKNSGSGSKSRKIQFDMDLPSDVLSGEEKLKMSYGILEEQDRLGGDVELAKVNPELFRNLKYTATVSPDIMNPRSEALERAFDLEQYDRMVGNPIANQEETFRLLLQTNPKTKKTPDKYIAQPPQPQMMPQPGMPDAGNSPLKAMGGKLPQEMNAPML